MKFQDEFARRLNAARGAGDGGEDKGPSTSSGRTDERESRHPEFISGPLAAEPKDRGERDGVLKRVQDDEDTSGDGGEVIPPSRLREGSGVGLCETESAVPKSPDTPTPSPSRKREGDSIRHDGWHPELRVKFLEALAQTGNVQASAFFVQRSRQSAYDLKRRDPDFARAWLAALVLAREEAQDKLQERAIEGVEEEIFYHGEVVATRRRYDSRLLLAHLARLDKIAAEIPAQRGAARFGDMLDAIAKGEDTAPLIATPTEEELAVRAAEAEAAALAEPEPEPPAAEPEDRAQFYEIRWPEDDGPPDYYRITPEAAAAMERDVPGLIARSMGTTDEALINSLIFDAQVLAETGHDWAAKGLDS